MKSSIGDIFDRCPSCNENQLIAEMAIAMLNDATYEEMDDLLSLACLEEDNLEAEAALTVAEIAQLMEEEVDWHH